MPQPPPAPTSGQLCLLGVALLWGTYAPALRCLPLLSCGQLRNSAVVFVTFPRFSWRLVLCSGWRDCSVRVFVTRFAMEIWPGAEPQHHPFCPYSAL